jgi:hypothetical protein
MSQICPVCRRCARDEPGPKLGALRSRYAGTIVARISSADNGYAIEINLLALRDALVFETLSGKIFIDGRIKTVHTLIEY